VSQTLAALDALWKRVGDGTPINRFFLDQHVQGLALLIAVVTVSVHALLVARANAARALRYD
jgi:hypothetical protein